MFIPLAQVEMLAVIAYVRSRKLRARDPVRLGKSFLGNVSPQVSIVLFALAQGEPKGIAGGRRRPWNSRRFHLLGYLPIFAVHSIDPPKITRTKPELTPVPGERLWGGSGRRETCYLGNGRQVAHESESTSASLLQQCSLQTDS